MRAWQCTDSLLQEPSRRVAQVLLRAVAWWQASFTSQAQLQLNEQASVEGITCSGHFG